MTPILYLNGKTAYVHYEYGNSRKMKKSDCKELIKNLEEFDCILGTDMMKKYIPMICKAGFLATDRNRYDFLDTKVHFKKLRFDIPEEYR
jgi:hypothetical protein